MDTGCFARLPVELYEEIMIVAAWANCEGNKPWLCALVTTSRRVLAILRPILYDTVCIATTPRRNIGAANFARVIAAAPAGHFALTRNLWVDILPDIWSRHRLDFCFPNAVHLSAGLLFLYHAPPIFQPARITVRMSLFRDDWRRLASDAGESAFLALRSLTHLRLAIDPYRGLPADPFTLSPALALQYVILESSTPGWNPTRLLNFVLPFFLSGTNVSLERLLICATMHPRYMSDAYALLEMYAREHRGRRLWVLDAPSDDRNRRQYRPGVTFDDSQWTAGRPVYAEAS